MEHLFNVLAALLTGIFFAGMLGSVVVILLTTFEDVKVLVEKDESRQPSEGLQYQ